MQKVNYQTTCVIHTFIAGNADRLLYHWNSISKQDAETVCFNHFVDKALVSKLKQIRIKSQRKYREAQDRLFPNTCRNVCTETEHQRSAALEAGSGSGVARFVDWVQ